VECAYDGSMGGPRAARRSDSGRDRPRRKEPVDQTVPPDAPAPGSGKAADPVTGADSPADVAPGLGPLTGWLETIPHIPEEPEAPEPAPEPDKGVVSNDLADNRPNTPDRAADALARTRRVAVVRLRAYRERLGGLAAHDLAWRARAQHARRMGPRLEKHLSPEWRVLHSVPLGGEATTVDHLLVGPGGVFTLSTHEHRDARVWVSRDEIRINGEPVPYLRPALAQAGRVARLLAAASGRRVRVTPCLVIVTGSTHPDIVVQDEIEGVLVLDSSTVVRTFRKLEPVLTHDDVEAVFDAARRRASWVIGGV
jgi:Nuclease-related domain